jgi:two-component system heavy metal sensor histidine kinase CusS
VSGGLAARDPTGAPRCLRSIAVGLAVKLAGVALVVFAVVAALLHWSLARELRFSERLQLESKAAALQQIVSRAEAAADGRRLEREIQDLETADGDVRIWIVDAGGVVLHGNAGDLPETRRDDEFVTSVASDGGTLATLRRPVIGNAMPAGTQMIIALHPRARLALMATFDRATVGVCAAGVLATSLLSIWVARRGLRPLHRLSAQAARISPQALSHRLSTPRDGLELASLVDSFNLSLGRVEEAWRQLEGFSADVAHELRTPLAVMITGFEVALSRPRPVEELRDVVASGLEEVRELSTIVEDMLLLARADRGEAAPDRSLVMVREQVAVVLDYLDASIEQGRHQVRIEGDAQAMANGSLLRRALFNLMTNAFRHTPAGETIVVRVERGEGEVRIAVLNPGDPLPDEVRMYMFDRFWRKDASRTKATEGHGLGLGIVRAVARMHGGGVFAGSVDGCTTVGFSVSAE